MNDSQCKSGAILSVRCSGARTAEWGEHQCRHMRRSRMHQTCKQCGRLQRFEFSVSDELWARSGCDPTETLCIECWLARAESAGLRSLSLGDFRFIGVAGFRIASVLYQLPPVPDED